MVQAWLEQTAMGGSDREAAMAWATSTTEAIGLAEATIAQARRQRGCRAIKARDRAREDATHARAVALDRRERLLQSADPLRLVQGRADGELVCKRCSIGRHLSELRDREQRGRAQHLPSMASNDDRQQLTTEQQGGPAELGTRTKGTRGQPTEATGKRGQSRSWEKQRTPGGNELTEGL